MSRILLVKGLVSCTDACKKFFENTRWKKGKPDVSRVPSPLRFCFYSTTEEGGSNLKIYGFPPFSMRIRIFKNFYIHPTICVAQFLLIFRTKGTRAHRVLGRLYSPFPFSLPLEKPATKVTYTCRWMSDIYQFGCCAKAAQGIVPACLVGV